MRIEVYFRRVQKVIESCSIIQLTSITYEKRSSYDGLIKGDLYFIDGSILYVREYIDTERAVDRLMYVYQYLSSSKGLIFRYDNTGHHKKLGISTYPHHKHEGSDDNVVSSTAPDLAKILKEIEPIIQLP